MTLAEADAALGPAPLVQNEDHARRVSDLHLYLRQHHGLRDTARIGRLLFYLGLDVANQKAPPRWEPSSYRAIVGR